MAQKTDAQLTTQKNEIKNETVANANSATRIGQMHEDVIDSKINNDKIDTANTLDTSGKTIPGRDAVKAYIASVFGGAGNLSDTDIDTLAEINAILTDADIATQTDLNSKSDATITYTPKTGAYTMAAAELTVLNAGGSLEMVSTGGGALTVPNNATLAIPVGKIFAIRGFTGVTSGGDTWSGTNGTLDIPSGTTAYAQKTASTTWTLHNASTGETTTTIGALINGATAKTTPVDADFIGLMDSAASNILKKLSWANIKATLKTYFDTLYENSLERVTVSTAGSTITLDMNSRRHRKFVGSASFSTPKTIALSNDTVIEEIIFFFTVTDVNAELTMPSSFVMSDINFDGSIWTPPATGKFMLGGSYDGTEIGVFIAGPLA